MGDLFYKEVKFAKVSNGVLVPSLACLDLQLIHLCIIACPIVRNQKTAQNGPYLATFGLLTSQMVIYMNQLD